MDKKLQPGSDDPPTGARMDAIKRQKPKITDLLDGLYHIARWGVAGLFIFAGLTKLAEPSRFAGIIAAYGLIPDLLVPPVAIGLPVVEALAGICLLGNRKGSLATITFLLVLFMAVLGYGLWLGLDVDCGCFGPEDPEAQAFQGLRPALYRNMMILVVLVGMYVWRYRRAQRPVRLINLI